MLRVLKVSASQITPELKEAIANHCLLASDSMPETLLSKHYKWTSLARYLSLAAPHGFMYLLFDDDTPVGISCFSESSPVHIGCTCVVEDLLYIAPEARSYRSALFFMRQVLQELRKEFRGTFLVFAGNSLGESSVEVLYQRAGYAKVGTHLVTELEGT